MTEKETDCVLPLIGYLLVVFVIQKMHVMFFFPIVSSIVVSIILTIIVNLFLSGK